VGDGQIQFVMEHEVESIRAALRSLKTVPKLTFIIVSKRINSK
jgi:hypothetical protein